MLNLQSQTADALLCRLQVLKSVEARNHRELKMSYKPSPAVGTSRLQLKKQLLKTRRLRAFLRVVHCDCKEGKQEEASFSQVTAEQME